MPTSITITAGVLAEARVRIIPRPWGDVVLTGVLQANTKDFRDAVAEWLRTESGSTWRASHLAEGGASP